MKKNTLNNKNARYEVRCGDWNNTVIFTNDWKKSKLVARFKTAAMVVLDLQAPDGQEEIVAPVVPEQPVKHTFSGFCTKQKQSYYYPVIKKADFTHDEKDALNDIQRVIQKSFRAKNVTLPQRAKALGMRIVNQESKTSFEVEW